MSFKQHEENADDFFKEMDQNQNTNKYGEINEVKVFPIRKQMPMFSLNKFGLVTKKY